MPIPSIDVSALRCRAQIDLSALRHNAQICQGLAGESTGVMAIVKADAYGHGLERIVTAVNHEVDWLGVANVREAERARLASASDIPILILSPATPSEIEPIVAGRFSASVSTLEEVTAFNAAAGNSRSRANLHAVADTGMGRMGALPEEFPHLVKAIQEAEHCELMGIETHFPSADEDEEFTQEQIGRFAKLIKPLDLPPEAQIHLGNSAGLIGFHQQTPFATLARPGLALYGIDPFCEGANLIPILSLHSKVTLVRDIPEGTSISYGRTFIAEQPMRVATLGVGYGDGYPRHLSGRDAEVLIGGRRCRLLGRVTMDQIVVDISHLETKVAPGDDAVLIGTQGGETITAAELAGKADTIPWEILTGITSRVDRVYLD
ncbi:MAG: alanine racemase [Verrucomicrobiales bacterium]|nr:alanine racemase [Verrucomicrobiales bacterium]